MSRLAAVDAEWIGALDGLVSEAVATQRAIAALEAKQSRVMSDAVDLVLARESLMRAGTGRAGAGDLATREVVAELGAALRVSDRTVQIRMGDAVALATSFAATRDAWERGTIGAAHVSAILDAGALIADPELRARFETRAIEIAVADSAPRAPPCVRSLRPSLLRPSSRPSGAPRPSGAFASSTSATVRRDCSSTRTMDQLRADVMTDLLLTGVPSAHGEGDALGAITGRVQVTVPVESLAGVTDGAALLAGYGPVHPDTVRRLAAHAPGWDRVLTDAFTGTVLAVERYRPSAQLRRFLGARDETCRFPGCRRPAHRCDIDHTIDAVIGGATEVGNLAHFCRRHHTLKHQTAWVVRQIGGGVVEWRGPTGRTYRDRPPSTVRFVPTPACADVGHGQGPPF